MEQRSDQQMLATPSLAPTAPPAATRPGAGNVFRRAMRLLLRRLMYFLTIGTRPFWRFAPFAAVIAILLGTIGWMGFQLWSPASGRDSRSTFISPSSDVVNYIKGQQNYNAELMWAAMSADLQASQLSGGASKQTLQVTVDKKKANGLSYSDYEYVGGVPSDSGGTMYFYAVAIQYQGQSLKLPMTITVNKDGKISDISSALSDLTKPTTGN